ncbi:MAG TPA: DUF6172 family protein [Opitutaceae bacterium]|nr:DUF6172 family protein [Opitutaceae bacterium]
MKKSFPLHQPGKVPARVVDSVKHEVRKYVRREHRKPLPEGFDLWSFACKVGGTAATAVACPLGEVSAQIDQVVAAGGTDVYIEIVATAEHRPQSSEAPAGR